mgnify:FL=1
MKTFSEKRTDERRIAKRGQTTAHIRYIARPQAARIVLQARLAGGSATEAAMRAEDDAYKRKGRVCERFVIALPVEATRKQREELTRSFAERFSQGIAGYIAAIHDQKGNDVNNPHAHFVFFDVQQKTGGRGRPKSTLGMARKHAITNTAQSWAELHNYKMRQWGFGANSEISHLSFADRDIDKIPTIHVGAAARAASIKFKQLSNPEWAHIDQGHSRSAANEIIRELNELKKEEKNAESVRLGTGNGDHKAKCGGGITQQRKRGRGNDHAFTGDEPPFLHNERADDSREQIGRSTSSTDGPVKSGPEPTVGGRSAPHPLYSLRFVGALRRRRSIRRVYRELIFMRDTLRTRLRTLGVQSRPHSDQSDQSDQIAPPPST